MYDRYDYDLHGRAETRYSPLSRFTFGCSVAVVVIGIAYWAAVTFS